jgi:Zn-dependent protease
MGKWLIPFRMHGSGWVLMMICGLIGVRLSGWVLGVPLGLALVVCLLLHEVGHMAMARALDVPVREFGLRMGGAYIRRAYASCRRDEILISAAGPAMNVLLSLPLLLVPLIGKQLALGNVALGVINLLPIPASDGMRILKNLRGEANPPGAVLAMSGPRKVESLRGDAKLAA